MPMIRCPGCKLDTSDSLEHCPNCGAGLNGKPARTVAGQTGYVAPAPAPGLPVQIPPVHTPPAASRAATLKSSNPLVRGILALIALVVCAKVPGGPAFVIFAAIAYTILRAKKTVSSAHIEAFRRFAEQASKNHAAGGPPPKRPLEFLREVEAEIKSSRRGGD